MRNSERRFICTGEMVYDILFKDDRPVEGIPGGSMLNTSVSLGRLGKNVFLAGDYADDAIGNIIERFLLRNNVSTEYVSKYDNALSRIAIAVLNENNDAEYTFYKIRKEGKAELLFPAPMADDLILFGSFYGIKEEIRDSLVKYIKASRNENALVIYDPNFRKNHLRIREQVLPFINENFSLANITKGSDEDFINILGTSDPKEIYNHFVGKGGRYLIMTANRHGVTLCTPQLMKHYAVKDIPVMSTVGAGDTFNSGLLYAFNKYKVFADSLESLPEHSWDKIIKTAISFAEHVCMSYENYLSWDFAREISGNG
ncbi:MAG: hypothetical protein CVU11_07290 [Bacteroidetes bacterium HGW-Bacteroidetes-6]|jgi:fructokinase|nr:MAG: hypothetical protein CVU11_07290 [Bacteroidetes bacterium HGW-Bacteroidetes-6]